MKSFSQFILSLLLFFGLLGYAHALEQASLEVVNNSQRDMTVKIMSIKNNTASFYNNMVIKPYAKGKIYFNETGMYFAKTKASIFGKNPIYQKGSPFNVVNDERGYSVLTLTFSIKESSVPQLTGGKGITQSEFEKN